MKKHYPKDPKKEEFLQELKKLDIKIRTRKKNNFKGFKWVKKNCLFFCNDQTEPTDHEEEVSLEEILLFWEELGRSNKKPAEP